MGTRKDSIAGALRERIQRGELRPGDQLPTVEALMAAHGVARETARGALSLLSDERLIISMRGRPAVVAPQVPLRIVRSDRYHRRNREALDGSTTFHREVAQSGWVGRIEYVNVGEVPCPEHAALLLGVPPGEPVVERSRLRRAAPKRPDGEPDMPLECTVELFDSYIPLWVAKRAPDVLTFGSPGVGGSYSSIERQGQTPIESPWRRTLRWRVTTEDEHVRMGIQRPRGVVVEDRVVLTTGRRPITTDRCVTFAELIVFEDDLVYEAA